MSDQLLQPLALADQAATGALHADHLPLQLAHQIRIVIVPDGEDYDFFAVCACGWVSAPMLDTSDVMRVECEIDVATRQATRRWQRYGDAIHTAESRKLGVSVEAQSQAQR
jgi:hypothetical protein